MYNQLESTVNQELEEAQAAGSSVLQMAIVLYRYRWGILVLICLGAIAGGMELNDHLPLQTTGTLRFVSAGVTYGNRSFWDLVQRTRVNQLRALAATESMPVSIRTVTEPWFLTIEVQHRRAGEGGQVLERLLQKLPEYRDAMGGPGKETGSPEIRRELIAEWQAACARVEVALQKLEANAELGEESLQEIPWGQTELPSISGPGTPLSLLPYSRWMQRLQQRTNRYFAKRAEQGAVPLSADELPLQTSLDDAMMLMLRYRGALDLTAAYQATVETTLDVVTEVPRPMLEEAVRKLLIGGWLGALLGALVCLPLHWLRVHWAAISAEVKQATTDLDSQAG